MSSTIKYTVLPFDDSCILYISVSFNRSSSHNQSYVTLRFHSHTYYDINFHNLVCVDL